MSEQRRVVVASEAGVSVRSVRDVPDAVAACFGTAGIILTEDDLTADFFDLRTGLAGELLQKFVNYRVRAAIVVPNPQVYGDRFAELVAEHRSHGIVRFVRSRGEADAWLGRD